MANENDVHYDSKTEFTRDEVRAALRREVGERIEGSGGLVHHSVELLMPDGRYYGLSRADWQHILHEARREGHHEYVAEVYDCDDFAPHLKDFVRDRLINGCGWAWSYDGKHMWNCLLVAGADGLEIAWCEPQTDKFVQLGETVNYPHGVSITYEIHKGVIYI